MWEYTVHKNIVGSDLIGRSVISSHSYVVSTSDEALRVCPLPCLMFSPVPPMLCLVNWSIFYCLALQYLKVRKSSKNPAVV
jgi:hypothetical protein